MHDPKQLRADHLPTPFTAAEIRAGCPPGRELRFRFERLGQQPLIRVTRYLGLDADTALQEAWQESVDGQPRDELEREQSTWFDLQQHASFPAATTTCEPDHVATPAGSFDCLRYTRVDEQGLWRFWFARDLPGQPVRFEQQVGEQVVFSATLIANTYTAPPSA
jgi:hypothetical protein